MKKLISITILFVMLVALATTMVSAVTTATLADELYAIGEKYGVSKAIIEREIKEIGVADDATAEKILAAAKEAEDVMVKAGVTDPTELTADQKAELVSIANRIAAEVGCDVEFKAGKIYLSKDGKLLASLTFENGKLVYTGNEMNSVLVVSSIAVLALATIFVARRKLANA